MEKVSLTVVIPAFNEAQHLAETVERLLTALDESGFDAELLLVDDGSTDGSADVVADAVGGRVPLSLVQQPNRGRFHAVRDGLRRATGRHVLVLGSRVRLRPHSLRFVRDRQHAGELVWTGHVHIHTGGNVFGTFQNVLTEIAWRDYFEHPRTTHFGLAEFDRYPKGSGCFIAPREVFANAYEDIPSRYGDVRHANDDAPMLRKIAASTRINISPSFAADYAPRASLRTFLRHTVHRGAVFLEGHGRRESRFFPYIVAFYPLSVLVLGASLRRPRVLLGVAFGASAAAGTVALLNRRSRFEVATVAALSPVWLTAFGAGLWRGLGMLAGAKMRRSSSE